MSSCSGPDCTHPDHKRPSLLHRVLGLPLWMPASPETTRDYRRIRRPDPQYCITRQERHGQPHPFSSRCVKGRSPMDLRTHRFSWRRRLK